MSTNMQITKILAIAAIAALPAAHAFAQEATIPNQIAISPAAAQAASSGAFAAKILPRQGYRGPVMFGNLKNTGTRHIAPPPGGADWSPANLSYFGGAYVQTASHVNVYWGEPNSATWGYPDSYEAYLNNSLMIHMTDQYVGTTANGRYPIAGVTWSGGSPGSYVSQAQIISLAQSIAATDVASYGQPGGYNNIIHIFLPPGTDTCFANNSACYNPDGAAPGPFAFCAYHSSTSVNGAEVLYTVEPYQHVNGCSTGSTVNNDTANVLGHEVFETITDPDPGAAWIVSSPLNYGSEIGDECAWRLFTHNLGGALYYTQDEYGNRLRACGDRP